MIGQFEEHLVRVGKAIRFPLSTTLTGVAPPTATVRVQAYDAALQRLAALMPGGASMDGEQILFAAASEIERLRARGGAHG